jgi:hypothetical protein
MLHRYMLVILLSLVPFAGKCFLCLSDSLLTRKQCMRGDVSGSFVTERNWWSEAQSTILLKCLAEARFRANYLSGWSHDHLFFTELGYCGFMDSSWIKNADILKLQFRWMEKGKRRLLHTYSIRFQTQWLNSWRYTQEQKSWQGGFMNPARLELGYSFTWQFYKNSCLHMTPATMQINVQPKLGAVSSLNEKPAFKTKHSDVYSRYGFSAQLAIDESYFNNILLWQQQSNLFFNALSRDQIQFDINNRLCFRFLKLFQLRLETTFTYFPEQSLKLQYRQEVLVGIFYEYRK